MGVNVSHTFGPNAMTPICNSCMVALCWDISIEEYEEDQDFWDDWQCRDCNPDYQGALQRYKFEKEHMIEILKKEAPKSYQEFLKWYQTDFAGMVFGNVANIEKAPISYTVSIMSIWCEKKDHKPQKNTPNEIIAIFKLME